MINVAKLQQLTTDAIQRGKDAAKAKEDARIKAEETQRKHNEQVARKILDAIAEKAETAASEGLNSLVVIRRVNFKDGRIGDLANIDGVTVLVYDACAQMGLNPKIEFFHDGQGYDGWWSLVIYW